MAGDIEFLPEESDDAADMVDEIDTGPRRRVAPVMRVLAVVLVLVGVVAWIATRPGGSPRSPSAHGLTTRSRPIRTVVTCMSGAPVPDEITNGMRRFLPGVTIDNLGADRCVRTIGAVRQVASQSVGAQLHGLRITVTIGQRGDALPPDVEVVRPGQEVALLASVETESAGVQVRVNARGMVGVHAPVYRLQRVADYLSLNIVL